jgi:integrase
MKGTGRHPEKALSAVQVRTLKAPGRYADGNGLYLVVEPSGNKHWVLRIMVQGKRCDIGLGGTTLVPLAEARQKALDYRKLAREGGNPIAERRATRRVMPTFSQAAIKVHAEHLPSWKNPKHGDQWINTLTQYAFPFIGETPVDRIDTPDVLRVLSPIWLTKAETARRVRQRIGTVLDWAKASGFRTGDNPVEGATKGLPKQTGREVHHAALPYAEVPGFIATLRDFAAAEAVRLAFEFLILTATRTNEVLEAPWSEIDERNMVWTIPADRMKAEREHRVPLPPRCIEILHLARRLSGDSLFIFPGRSAEKPLSNMAFLMVLRRMQSTVTAHGFRSSFRDWASEQTNFPREVCEMALAHGVENKVEAAYRRGDLFEKRRELMAAWADFATQNQLEQDTKKEVLK